MLSVTAGRRIYLATEPTDLRKSFDGLSTLVESKFGMDPATGDLFVFLNRRQNQVRVLYWDRDGFCIVMKRLELGTFRRMGIPEHLGAQSGHVGAQSGAFGHGSAATSVSGEGLTFRTSSRGLSVCDRTARSA